MKNILMTVVLTLALSTAKAQTEYCKDIKRTINDLKADTVYNSPIQPGTKAVQLRKKSGFPYPFIIFTVSKPNANYSAKGVYIKFDDGTVVSNSDDVDCTYLNSEDHYLYTVSLLLDDENKNSFKTKKIVRYQIDNVDVPIDEKFAIKFMAWVNCIETIK